MNNENLSVRLTKASAIEMKPINWIWNGWLASGKFHVLGGMAGTGKSTIAMSICAAISSGGLFPDGQRAEQGDVVIWTGEDDPQGTLAPRLKAMGADLNRVHFVGTVNNGGTQRPFDPKNDMHSLQERIAELPNIKLLVIDPIVSIIKKDGNSNSDVRNDLTPTVQMAAELDFAVIGITHFSKNTSGNDPLERITGSLAFGAIPRVVWAVTRV
jgi:putative DNA primase/helicase